MTFSLFLKIIESPGEILPYINLRTRISSLENSIAWAMQRFTMSSIWTLIFFSGRNSCSLDWFNNHRCHLSWCNSHRGDHRSHCNRSDSWSANLNNFLSYIQRINFTWIVYNSYIRLWSWCWRIVLTSSIIINLNIGIMMDICLIILNSSCVVDLRWTVGIHSVLILLWLVLKMIK